VNMPTGQTDGRTPDHYITLSARHDKCNKSQDNQLLQVWPIIDHWKQRWRLLAHSNQYKLLCYSMTVSTDIMSAQFIVETKLNNMQ